MNCCSATAFNRGADKPKDENDITCLNLRGKAGAFVYKDKAYNVLLALAT